MQFSAGIARQTERSHTTTSCASTMPWCNFSQTEWALRKKAY
jgi:hypothetical protein